MADNIHFDLCGVPLKLSLQVAFDGDRKALGWAIDPAKGLILYSSESPKCTLFPVPLELDEVFPLIEKWLATVAYPSRPTIDGSLSKGWRVYNEDWGKVNGEWEAFAAITPVWMLHGK